jgi:hypothetical protein
MCELISDWEVLVPLENALSCPVFLLGWGIPRFFLRFPFLILVFFLRLVCINHMDFVTANRQLVSSSFEILRADIPPCFCLQPLKSRRDQLHQVIYEYPPAFLWIEQGMREPGVHPSRPLLHMQGGERWAIHVLEGEQHIAHVSLGMAGNLTRGVKAISAPAKLHPHRFWLVKDLFEGNGRPRPAVTKHNPNG